MSRESLRLLLERYQQNQCSAEEKLMIEKLYGMLDKEDLDEILPNEFDTIEQKLWYNISQQISSATPNSPSLTRRPSRKISQIIWYAAAVIAAFTLFTTYLFFQDSKSPEYLAFRAASDLVAKKNNTRSPLAIQLEDGSKVVLQPGAILCYPLHFKPAKREVSLQGEGYFLISKNPHRPFFVYNKSVITRVVGTSFIIKTNQLTDQTEVIVKTGKVVVCTNENKSLSLKHLLNKADQVVLTPNQKTIYHPDDENFETSLVPDPILIAGKYPQKVTGQFDDVPLLTVLNELQQLYGISIVVKNPELTKNNFTGDISGQNLYKKLDLICHTIRAYYEISGTRIIIKEKKQH